NGPGPRRSGFSRASIRLAGRNAPRCRNGPPAPCGPWEAGFRSASSSEPFGVAACGRFPRGRVPYSMLILKGSRAASARSQETGMDLSFSAARMPLIDPFGRAITYLRVSVTDRCDFRCVYCMAENMTFLPKRDLLTLEELDRLCSAFIARGVRKIRLTGG